MSILKTLELYRFLKFDILKINYSATKNPNICMSFSKLHQKLFLETKKRTIFFWILQQSISLNDGEGLRPEIRTVNYTIGAEERLSSVPVSFFCHSTLSLFFLIFCYISVYIPARTFVSQHANWVVSDSVHRNQHKEL